LEFAAVDDSGHEDLVVCRPVENPPIADAQVQPGRAADQRLDAQVRFALYEAPESGFDPVEFWARAEAA